MSTFGGKFEEIPGISVDKFDEPNLDSYAFFISHCHADHMEGLNSKPFEERLYKDEKTFLYTSAVSAAILKLLYPKLGRKLKTLDLHDSNVVEVNGDYITVTLISAGHCPGSVMFLFEADKTVLYTGDFRINPSDLSKFKNFHDSIGEVKPIDTIYLDTSFFDTSHQSFPKREDSLNRICDLIEKWLINDENIIEIRTSARYGSEYLFIEIAKKFNMPVHVSNNAYLFYKCIPEMDGTITLDGSITRIHSSCGPSFKEICHGNSERVRSIKPSVLIWSAEDLKKVNVMEKKDGIYRVCYSCHASYEECLALIDFLKPKKIHPCVLPRNHCQQSEMYSLIEKVIAKHNTIDKCSADKTFFNTADKVTSIIVTPEKKRQCDNFILKSPPRVRRRFEF